MVRLMVMETWVVLEKVGLVWIQMELALMD
jgi:hypothetical protein